MDYCIALDWEGMNAEAWAAWAQALLTVFTFAVALFYQRRREVRMDRRQRIQDRTARLSLAAAALFRASVSLRGYKGQIDDVVRNPRLNDFDRWEAMVRAFRPPDGVLPTGSELVFDPGWVTTLQTSLVNFHRAADELRGLSIRTEIAASAALADHSEVFREVILQLEKAIKSTDDALIGIARESNQSQSAIKDNA